MFDDFHESSRSVGLAGLLLGLLVLAGFCGLGMAVLSGDAGSKGPTLATRVIDQGRMIDQLSGTLRIQKEKLGKLTMKSDTATRSAKTSAEISGDLAIENRLVEKHDASVKKLNEELDGIQKKFEGYRDRYRSNERSLAIGEVLDLSETMGEGYEKSTVREISPLHLRVMRSAGPEGIPYEKLPAAVQDRFQFGKEEAAAFQGRMNAVNAKRGVIAAANKKRMDQKKGVERVAALTQQIKKVEAEIIAKTIFADEQADEASDLEKEAKRFDSDAKIARATGKISMSKGKATQARNKARLRVKRANQARFEVTKLNKELAELELQLRAVKK